MPEPSDAWWSRAAGDLMSELDSGTDGLSRETARARLAETGPNLPAEQDRLSAARIMLRQYESPLVLILIFAACVSLVIREWAEAGIILAIVGASTLLSFVQEFRAAVSVEALRSRLALTVSVLRDGTATTIPADDVVRGDVVLLSAGNLVPADGVVIEARDFLVTQAALTGESSPVEKRAGTSGAEAPLADRLNAVFQGTSVRSGTAKVLVVKTAGETIYADIAQRVAGASPETDFERGIRRFGMLLTRIMTAVVLVVLVANLALDRPVIESLLFSVALAVGLTPELLPVIISVTMANGARRLARKGVIVRRTAAIEDLGGIDVLCTDKTGTLTTGAVTLVDATDPAGQSSETVLSLAFTNAALETGIDNPLDTAIVAVAEQKGLPKPISGKIDEIPYDFLRRRLSIVVDLENDERHLMITKGAFSAVLDCCTQIANGSGSAPLSPDVRAGLESIAKSRGQGGERLLALATRSVGPKARYGVGDERGMIFAGFLVFADPLKPGIVDTLERIRRLGISTKIITGDNRHVARHVARAVGLTDTLLTGGELNRTRDEALWHLAETIDVFAEVDPQQKERIVRALQRRGHAVAYMGDGINDAPALSLADVGISVDQAVDVARQSADIVLLEPDLDVLADGVIDGRRTFANTLKYVSITTSANFGNMISMAIGAVFLPFLPMTPAQILLNNFLSDIPSVALAGDSVDPEAVAKAPRWDMAAIRRFMLTFGLLSTAFDLLTFFVLIQFLQAGESLFQSTWFMISLLTELGVLFILRTRRPVFGSRPGCALLLLSACVAGIALVLPWLGVSVSLFGFTTPTGLALLAAVVVVLSYFVASEGLKRTYFKRVTSNRSTDRPDQPRTRGSKS